MRIAGSHVVITGAAHGIGAALARRFVQEGAAGLLLTDLDGTATRALAEELEAEGADVLAEVVDVRDPDAIEAMVEHAQARFGGVDLLCSNAGVGTGQGLEADPEAWDGAWSVNVMAHVHAARAVIPAMLERGSGHILATCSAAGLLTMVGDAPYSVTKHGAVAFAEWLAVTYGPRGIGVSALCPQGVATALLDDGGGPASLATRVVRAAAEVLEPEDVAECVVQGLADERFLILPHAQVGDHYRNKAADPDRWIAGLQRFASSVEAADLAPRGEGNDPGGGVG